MTGGLGSCLAEQYLNKGYRVFGFDVNIMTDKIKQLHTEFPNKCFVYTADVRNMDEIKKVAGIIASYTTSIDILFNNAAILPDNSANVLEAFDIEASLDVFSVNSLGPLRVIKEFLPFLQEGEDKLIVNISSEAGSMTTQCSYITRYDYCMSKAALNIQSIILSRYLDGKGIRVLVVHPGWMRTGMGGPEAPVLPETSAQGIQALISEYPHFGEHAMFFDYDGSPRGW